MVREQIWRRKKYEAKLDGDVAEIRTTDYRSDMVDLHTAITTILVQREEQAKTQILEPAGIPTSEIPFYLNSMREFCKCCRNFTSVTRDNKCHNILLQYRDKNLQIAILYKLAMLCGCYPEGWQYYY